MSGKYYPNNADAIANAPDEVFEPCTWEEFYDWRLCAWEIPASVSCIIRAVHKDTGKVTEHVYQNTKAAQKRLIKYMSDGMYEVTVANHDSIHLVKLQEYDDTATDLKSLVKRSSMRFYHTAIQFLSQIVRTCMIIST